MLENIKYEGEVIAIILRQGFSKEGTNFLTEPDDALQLGALQHKKGKIIKPHKHLKIKKEIDSVNEALFVQSGKVEVTFYDNESNKIESSILNQGDLVLMKKLGHGFKLLEDSKIIEIKQGPYSGQESDKVYLDI